MKLSTLCLSPATIVPLALAALFLTSCEDVSVTSGPPVPHRVPFNEAEFAPYLRSGAATVVGQAAITFKNGSVRPGRNIEIDLVPVTSYTQEIVQRKIIRREDLQGRDPRYDKYVRTAQTDDMGNFEFHRVPAGEYFLGGVVIWEEPENIPAHHEKWAWDRITVGAGQTVQADITQ
jgi:hypothetical protein